MIRLLIHLACLTCSLLVMSDGGVQTYRVDEIEVNEVFCWDVTNERWQPTCHQVIAWDNGGDFDRVACWKLYKPSMAPRFDYLRQEWVSRWSETVEIRAGVRKLSMTDFDPELVNREAWDARKRRLGGIK